MKLYNLKDNTKALMPEGKADYLLAACVTLTCKITGITQAGIPGKISLTPTLDAEFLSTGKVFSLEDIAETASGIPTPGLITRAVHRLTPFSYIGILNLGLEVIPKECEVYDFDIKPSPDITQSSSFDAEAVFEKGRAFGREYQLRGDYLILGESTPSGTTTAQASISALGFETDSLFASSFKNSPIDIKKSTIKASLSKIKPSMNSFEKLAHTSDNMLMFVAGFTLEASRRFKIVLGGGTQMAAALLIADTLAEKYQIHHDYRNIYLATTSWIAKDGSSDISKLLDTLSFRIKALYSDFSYADADIPVLKLYDEGEAKEGVGAGAALAYASCKNISQKEITNKVQELMSGI
jgi:uncharacterized protein (TIGR00303 family)